MRSPAINNRGSRPPLNQDSCWHPWHPGTLGTLAPLAPWALCPPARCALPDGLRIDAVAQTVAEEVEPEDQDRNRQPWKNGEMRRIEQVRPPRIQHRPPAGCRRLDAKPEETQCRLR